MTIYQHRWIRRAATMTTLAAVLATTSCAGWITLVAAVYDEFKRYKQLHEAYVQDIKRQYQPTDAAYVEAERNYIAARTLYESYLEAVKVAVASGHDEASFVRLATDVQSASTAFLANATRTLSPNLEGRAIPFHKAAALPADLHQKLLRVPQKHRGMVLEKGDDELHWRSWDAI